MTLSFQSPSKIKIDDINLFHNIPTACYLVMRTKEVYLACFVLDKSMSAASILPIIPQALTHTRGLSVRS